MKKLVPVLIALLLMASFACAYEAATPFTEGFTAVGMGGKFAYIDRTGEFITPYLYDGADDFAAGGLARVMREGKAGFIDISGQEIIPCIYEQVDWFFGDYSGVQLNGLWGVVNRNGAARVRRYDTYYHINSEFHAFGSYYMD